MKLWHKFLNWVAGFSPKYRYAKEELKHLRASCGGLKSANTKLRRANAILEHSYVYIKNLERQCYLLKINAAEDKQSLNRALADKEQAEFRLAEMVKSYRDLYYDRTGRKPHPEPEQWAIQ